MELFLDVDKKIWKINDLEIPVIEDTPMKEIQWFRDKTKEAHELESNDKLSPVDAMNFDEEWWEKTCQLGLGKSMKEIIDTGLSQKRFRSLMAEVYNFLAEITTIEEAKQLGLYAPETKKKNEKH